MISIPKLFAKSKKASANRRSRLVERRRRLGLEQLEPRVVFATSVLQGPSVSTDAYLTSLQNLNANLGGAAITQLYRSASGNESYRPMIKFDLSTISTVGEAYLDFYQIPTSHYNGTPLTGDLYAVNQDWEEGNSSDNFATTPGVSWNKRTSTQNWTTPGGTWNTVMDFGNGTNGRIATGTFSPALDNSWIRFNVTNAVKAWKNNQLVNNGFIMVLSGGSSSEYSLASSEYSNPAFAPKLTVMDVQPVISISGVCVSEGNTGTTVASLTVSLSKATTVPVTVNYATVGQSATSGIDFTPTSGTLTFAPGQTSQTIAVNVIGDTLFEAEETLFVQLSNPTNSTIGNSTGEVKITDNDAAVPVTLQGPTVTQDNFMTSAENAIANLGGRQTLELFRNAGGTGVYRPMLRFDLSTVPVAGTSTLQFFHLPTTENYAGLAMTAEIYALNRDWEEGTGTDNYATNATGASWSRATSTQTWTTVGGDRNTTTDFGLGPNGRIATGTFSLATEGTWVSFDVTKAVAAWKSGQLPNFGFVMVLTSGDSTAYALASSEYADSTKAPKLVVGAAPVGPPTISIGNISQPEGNTGTTPATLTVSLSKASTSTVTVSYATESQTAIAGSDFSAASGTITFTAGQLSKTISINVAGDTENEVDENFLVRLSAPTNATIGTSTATVTIQNDDRNIFDLPLFDRSDLTRGYVGGFRLPNVPVQTNSSGTILNGGFNFYGSYGGSGLAMGAPGDSSLYMTGFSNAGTNGNPVIAKVSIPTFLSPNPAQMQTAQLLQSADLRGKLESNSKGVLAPVTFSGNGDPNDGFGGGVRIDDLIVTGNSIIGSAYVGYGDGLETHSHFRINTLDLNQVTNANVTGLFNVGTGLGGVTYPGWTGPTGLDGTEAAFLGGYMTEIPAEYQASLGGTHLVGQSASTVMSRGSLGPGAFALNAANIGVGTVTPKPLAYYPDLARSLYPMNFNYDTAQPTDPRFNFNTNVEGAVFVPGTRTVLFFGSTGAAGIADTAGSFTGYGESATFNDNVRTDKGYHSQNGAYEYQVWAYDVNDYIKVVNGQLLPWDVEPYDVWRFDFDAMPDAPNSASKYVGGTTFDPITNRLYVTQQFIGDGITHIVQVFDLGIARQLRSTEGELVGSTAPTVTQAAAAPILAAAVQIWGLTSLTPIEAARLPLMTIAISNLPGDRLASISGNTIIVDSNAAGRGWFVDPTPLGDTEYVNEVATTGGAADNKVDLLTAILHELGHSIGRDHDLNGIMGGSLAKSRRVKP